MSAPRHLNRVLLAFTGLLLCAGGTLALLAGLGVLTPVDPASPLVPEPGAPVPWFAHPIALTAGAVVVGLACVAWLLAQVPQRRGGGVWPLTAANPPAGHTPAGHPPAGHTSIDSTVLVGPVEDDIRSYPGVRTATAGLTGGPDAPVLDLRIGVEPGTDLSALRSRIDDHALTRLSAALATPVLRGSMLFHLDTTAGRRPRGVVREGRQPL